MDKDNKLSNLSTSGIRGKSEWSAHARERRNRPGLSLSIQIGVMILMHMREHKIDRDKLASKLDISTQYLGRILKGQENLTLDTIADLSNKLGIDLLTVGSEGRRKPTSVVQHIILVQPSGVKEYSKGKSNNIVNRKPMMQIVA